MLLSNHVRRTSQAIATPVRPTPAPQWTKTGVLLFFPTGTSATEWRRTVSISSKKPNLSCIENYWMQT